MAGKYRVIYADPPWRVDAGPRWAINETSKPLTYPTMSVEEICALPVEKLADTPAAIFLWTINAHIEDSYRVMRAWGFKPKQMLTWVKSPNGSGLGSVFGSTTEFLLFGTRGRIGVFDKDKDFVRERYPSTWFDSKRGPHSRKPLMAREIIDRCFDGPKIELFAREAFLGWDAWGNEVKSDVDIKVGACPPP